MSDLVILVEGLTDTPIIEEFLIKLGLSDKYNIKIWPFGGDIMAQLDLSVFAQQYKIIALVDKDPSSRTIRKQFTANCKELGIPVHQTQRYAIENYFSLRAIREIFGDQVIESITELDPKGRLENQIGINVKKNNRKLSQATTLEEIKDTDLAKFFDQVEQLCAGK